MTSSITVHRPTRFVPHPSWGPKTTALVRALRSAAQRSTFEMTPVQTRRLLERIAWLAPRVSGIRRTDARVGGVPATWYLPSGHRGPDARVLMHLHGGGFALCSQRTHGTMVSELATAAGARGLLPRYRLAPEHPYPAALDDCEAAYVGLLASGVHPSRIILSGDSAGGNLVVSLAVRLREAGIPLPRALVLLSPWVDLTASGVSVDSNACYDYVTRPILDRFAELYAASCDPTSPELSPLRANLRGLPPTLIQVGGAESLLSEGCEFAAKARAAGVQVSLQKWEGMVHAWQGYSFALPDARDAIAEVGRYVHRLYGARAAIEQRPIPTLAPAFAGPTRSRR
ncbi:MAG: alpha/beta hydrolase [Myxococcales bacterium]|nr:alpha/beta hydrolase [Myxococcales bacterium]